MIPGGLSLIGSFLNKPFANLATQQIYTGLKHESIQFVSPLVDKIISGSTQTTLIYSGAVFFLGLILIIISFIMRNIPQKVVAPTPSAQTPTPTTGGLTEAK